MGKHISRMLLLLFLGISIGFFIEEMVNSFFEETSTTVEDNIASEDQEPTVIERFVDKIKKIIYLWQKLYKSEIYDKVFPNYKNDQYASQIESSKKNETQTVSIIKEKKVGTYAISTEQDITKIPTPNSVSNSTPVFKKNKLYDIKEIQESIQEIGSFQPYKINNKRNDLSNNTKKHFQNPKVFRRNRKKSIRNNITTSAPSGITLEISDDNKFKSSSPTYETYLFDCKEIVNTTAQVTKNVESLNMNQYISSFSVIPKRLSDNEPVNYKSSSPTYETYFFDCSDIVNSIPIITETSMKDIIVTTSYNDSKSEHSIEESTIIHKTSGFTDNSERTDGNDKKISTPISETYFFDCSDIVNSIPIISETSMKDITVTTSYNDNKTEHNIEESSFSGQKTSDFTDNISERTGGNDKKIRDYSTPTYETYFFDCSDIVNSISNISETSMKYITVTTSYNDNKTEHNTEESSFSSHKTSGFTDKYSERTGGKDKKISDSSTLTYETYFFECKDIVNSTTTMKDLMLESTSTRELKNEDNLGLNANEDLNQTLDYTPQGATKTTDASFSIISTNMETSFFSESPENKYPEIDKMSSPSYETYYFDCSDIDIFSMPISSEAVNIKTISSLNYQNTDNKEKSEVENYFPSSTTLKTYYSLKDSNIDDDSTDIENTFKQASKAKLKHTTFTVSPLIYGTLNTEKGEDFTTSDHETYNTDLISNTSAIENNNPSSSDIESTSEQTSETNVKDTTINDLLLDYGTLNLTKIWDSKSDHETYSTGISKEISSIGNYIPTSTNIENISVQTSEGNLKDVTIADLPLDYKTLNSKKGGYSTTSDHEIYSTNTRKEISVIEKSTWTSTDIINTSVQTSEANLKDVTITDLPLDYETLNSTKGGYSTISDHETYSTGVSKEISLIENYIPTSTKIENTSVQTSEANLKDATITYLPLDYETLNSTKGGYSTTIDNETYSTGVSMEISLIGSYIPTSTNIENTSVRTSEANLKDATITYLPLDYETLNSTKGGYSTTIDNETYSTGVSMEISLIGSYKSTSENTSGQTSETNVKDTTITDFPLDYETLNLTKDEYSTTSDHETYSKDIRKEISVIENSKSTSTDIVNTSVQTSEANLKDATITDLPLDYETPNSTKVGVSTTSDHETYSRDISTEISIIENYKPISTKIENTSEETTFNVIPLDYATLNLKKGDDFTTSDHKTDFTDVGTKTSAYQIENIESTSTDIENTSGLTSETYLKDTTVTDLPLVYETQNLTKGGDSTISNDETYSTDIRKEISVIEKSTWTSTDIINTSVQTSEANLKDVTITDLPLDYETLNSTKGGYSTISDHETYSTAVSKEISLIGNYIQKSTNIENTSVQTSEANLKDATITYLPLDYETLNSTKGGYSTTSDRETYSTGVSMEISLIGSYKPTSENTSGQTSETNVKDTTITDFPLDYETLNSTNIDGYSTTSDHETYSTDIRKEISVIENSKSTSTVIINTSVQTSEANLKDVTITDLPLDYETMNSTKGGYSTISDHETYSTAVSKEISLIGNYIPKSTNIENTSVQTSKANLKDATITYLPQDYETLNSTKGGYSTTIDNETYSTGVSMEISLIGSYKPMSENTSGQTSETNVKDTTITDFPLDYETLNSTNIDGYSTTSYQETYSTDIRKEISVIENSKSTSTDIVNTSVQTSEANLKDATITDLPLDYETPNSTKVGVSTTSDHETYSRDISTEISIIENYMPISTKIENTSEETTFNVLPLDYATLNLKKGDDFTTSDHKTYFTDVGTKTSASQIENIESTSTDIENTSGQTSEANLKDVTITALPLDYETLNSTKGGYSTISDHDTYSTAVSKEISLIGNYIPKSTNIENTSVQTSEDSLKETTITDFLLDYGILNLTKVWDSTTSDHVTYSRDISMEISVIENNKPTNTHIEQTSEKPLRDATITDLPLGLPDEEFDYEKDGYFVYGNDVTYFTNISSEMTFVKINKPSSSALPTFWLTKDLKNTPTQTSGDETFTNKSSNIYSSEGIKNAIALSTNSLTDLDIKSIQTIDKKETDEATEPTSSVTSITSKKSCEETNTDISDYDLWISFNTTHLWGDVALTINVPCPLDQITLHFQGVSVSFSSLHEIMTATPEKVQIVVLKYMDYDKQRSKILIQLMSKIKPEYTYVLNLKFISELSPFERGATLTTFLTRSVGYHTRKRAWIIGTFMFPNFGKLVFPCILAPERRSKFHLRLNRSMGVEALSNSLKVKTAGLSKEKVVDDFYKTPAIPISSFMFNILPNYDSFIVERTPSLAFWYPPYLKYSVEPMVNIANDILDFFIEYFQYHLPIQQIAIIVREDLYSDPPASFATILISSKYLFENYERNYENKENIYHFLAKQFCDLWIGNVVGFSSWNDNWIKEGFSIYMAHLATMHIYNDYDYSSFIIRIQQKAFWYHRFPFLKESNLPQDGLYTNKKVKNDTPYKGAFLLHMVYNILKPQPFQEAIRFLFTEWAMQSINPDAFWGSFNTIQENLDIKEFIKSWAFNHYPTLNVHLENNSVIIKQVPRPGSYYDYSSWWIPINYLTGRDINYDYTITHWMKQQQSIRIKIHFNDTWIIFNPQYAGFARFNYSRDLWKMIITGLRKGTAQLPSSIKAQLLDDAFTLASENSLDYSVPMTLALYLKSEEDYAPWFVALTHFSYLAEVLVNYPEWQIFQQYMAGIISDISLKLQIKKDSVAEPEILGQLRKILMTWSCLNDLSNGCDKWALQKFLKWKDDPSYLSKNIILTELKSIIYCTGAKLYDDETSKYLYSFSKAQMITTGESLKLLRGVTCANKFMTFMEILNDIFDINNPSFSFLRLKEFVLSLKQSHVNSLLSFRYLKHYWKSIYKRFHDSNGILDAIIEGATYFLRTKEHYREVLTLIKSVPESDHNTLASLNLAVDQIVYNINWDIRNLDKFRKWLIFYNKTIV